MADNDQKPGDGQNLLLLNLPNLAVFLFLSWGVLSTKAPLTSLRPEASQGTDTIQSLNVEARFWQDPFFWRMNTNGVEAQAAIPEPNDAFISDSAAVPVQARNSESVLGLVVLLNGDRYPEAIEARIRARYAIVSAML